MQAGKTRTYRRALVAPSNVRYLQSMPVDPVVELLAKQTAARLRDMAAQIDTQISDLRVQRAWIDRALEVKQPSTASSERTATTSKSTTKSRRSSKRDAIKALMQTDPDRTWLPSEVRDGLAARDIESTAGAVRVALRRMGDDHEVVRPDDGHGWKLASSNGSGNVQESLAEAPSSEQGGYGQ